MPEEWALPVSYAAIAISLITLTVEFFVWRRSRAIIRQQEQWELEDQELEAEANEAHYRSGLADGIRIGDQRGSSPAVRLRLGIGSLWTDRRFGRSAYVNGRVRRSKTGIHGVTGRSQDWVIGMTLWTLWMLFLVVRAVETVWDMIKARKRKP
jgi:hypothetical protein